MDPLRIGLWLVFVMSSIYLLIRALITTSRMTRGRRAYREIATVPCPIASDRARGCLIGVAVGDALGLPAESLPRWLVRLRYPNGPKMRGGIMRILRRPGDVSDDTQLTIAVALGLVDEGTLGTSFENELVRWLDFRIGAGRACVEAARLAKKGHAKGSVLSLGNGAAIRVAPLAISQSGDQLVDAVRNNARLTHARDEAIAGALFMALLIRECLERNAGFLDDTSALRMCVNELQKRSQFLITNTAPKAPSGHVRESISAVVHHLFRHGSNFEAAMRDAFFSGGDTDSVASMTAACIGAQVGYTQLPKRWTSAVQHHDLLLSLADHLSWARVIELA